MSLLSSFNCCFKNKSKVAATTVTSGFGTQEKEPLGKEDYYDFLAPSVHHLQTSFLNAIEESGLDRTATLYDIEDLMSNEPGLIRKRGLTHTCPIDGEVGSSYVHSLELDSSGKDHVGTANYMLSYAWGYSYSDIVDTLVEFCRVNELDPKRTYIWICAFCNNQHRVVERDVPFDEFKYVFKRRVKGIGNILAMMTPWHDPGYLKRVWCIFEMYSANADDDTNIQIIMPPAQKNSLMNAVLKPTDATGKNGLDELFATLASTSVEKAQSSRIRDKENILRLVEDGPGCQSFNNEINRLLRKWVMDTVFEAANEKEASLQEQEGYSFDEETRNTTKRQAATFLTFCASYFSRVGAHKEALELHQKGLDIYKTLPMPEDSNDADSPKELMARCYNNMGTEHESLGNYEEALKMHHQCREAFEDIYGTDHENTSVSYFNIGAVLRKMEKTEEAVEMYTKSMDIDSRIKGEDHIDVGLSLSYIGRVMQANGDYEDALKNFEKSLKIRKDTYGDTHPDVSIGYGDMGLLHHMKGDYAKAIEYHEQALTIQEQLLGTSHPDTASIYQNLGGAYYEMGPEHYDTALELHKKAKSAYLTTFGEEHPKAKVSQEWIDIVENAIAENS